MFLSKKNSLFLWRGWIFFYITQKIKKEKVKKKKRKSYKWKRDNVVQKRPKCGGGETKATPTVEDKLYFLRKWRSIWKSALEYESFFE